MIETRNEKILRYTRYAFMGIFLVALLMSIGYWMYEVYNLYEDPRPCVQNDLANCLIDDLTNIFHDSTHGVVAFQAAILSFLLFVAAYRL